MANPLSFFRSRKRADDDPDSDATMAADELLGEVEVDGVNLEAALPDSPENGREGSLAEMPVQPVAAADASTPQDLVAQSASVEASADGAEPSSAAEPAGVERRTIGTLIERSEARAAEAEATAEEVEIEETAESSEQAGSSEAAVAANETPADPAGKNKDSGVDAASEDPSSAAGEETTEAETPAAGGVSITDIMDPERGSSPPEEEAIGVAAGAEPAPEPAPDGDEPDAGAEGEVIEIAAAEPVPPLDVVPPVPPQDATEGEATEGADGGPEAAAAVEAPVEAEAASPPVEDAELVVAEATPDEAPEPPAVEEPAAPEPAAVDPAAAEPAVAESPAIEPVAAGPAAVEPPVVEPVVAEPAAVEPPAVEPAVAEPAVVEPPAVEPAVAEPAAVEPPAVEPAAAEPAAVEPIVTEPTVAEAPAAEAQAAVPPSTVPQPVAAESAAPETAADLPADASTPEPVVAETVVEQPAVEPTNPPVPAEAAPTPASAQGAAGPVETQTPESPPEPERAPVLPADAPAEQASSEPREDQPQISDLLPTAAQREAAYAATRTVYNEALQAVGRFFSAARDLSEGGGAGPLPIADVETAAAKLVSGMAQEHVSDGLVACAVGAYPDEGSFIVPHSVNVTVLSQRVAAHLGLEGQELHTLAVAALLHDVGTVRIPKETFYKDDSLSNDEWVMMRQRPTFSAEIIRSMGPAYRAVAEIAHQVHERLDGNGYPRGLQVDTIALEASILGAVDIFDAFIHSRPYKRTVPAAAMYGVDNLMRLSHQFGDGVLKALVRSVGLFPVGTFVRLNSGEVARVLRGRSTNPMRPEVEVVIDSQKQELESPRYLDLMATPHLYVFKPMSPEDMAEFGLK